MTVDEVVALAVAYYSQPEDPHHGPYWSSGGNLHVALDDGNLANSHVAFCLLRAHDDPADTHGERLAFALLDLSVTQRGVVYKRLHQQLRDARASTRR